MSSLPDGRRFYLTGLEGKLNPILHCLLDTSPWMSPQASPAIAPTCHLPLTKPMLPHAPPQFKALSLKPQHPLLLPLWRRDAGINGLEERKNTFHLCQSPSRPPQENHRLWTFGHQTLQLVGAVETGPQVRSDKKWAFYLKSATAYWDMSGARWTWQTGTRSPEVSWCKPVRWIVSSKTSLKS